VRNALGRTFVCVAIAGHLAEAMLKVGLCFRRWSDDRRHDEIGNWSSRALEIFGIRTVVVGRPPARDRAHLLVANHVSWLDVHCILSRTRASFVAKADVNAWPIIGTLAGHLETIFVSRGQNALRAEMSAIRERLAAGRPICMFPEGTSSDGSQILPFRSAFFEAAIAAGAPVQPIAIRYRRADGTRADEAAFTGDTTLVQSFRRLAASPGMTAEVHFLDPIEPAGLSRRELARRAEIAIRTALEAGGSEAFLDRAA
jgi:1-acyl-sn-glycerol-3-phosphate acyltransferase